MDRKRFHEDDFNEFLESLIQSGRLDAMQSGITKLVIDRGYDRLSPKQKKVFDYMIDTNSVEICERCANEIPWNEMIFALDNGGYYCQYIEDKIKEE